MEGTGGRYTKMEVLQKQKNVVCEFRMGLVGDVPISLVQKFTERTNIGTCPGHVLGVGAGAVLVVFTEDTGHRMG